MRSIEQAGALVTGSPGNDSAAFAAWVRPYWSDMQLLARRLCGPDLADDAVQEALTSAWRKSAQFDPARGTARSWLLAVVADQTYKQRRKLRTTVQLTDEHTVPGPERQLDTTVDLSVALRQLSRRQRLAVSLFYYLDVSAAETAQVMGCSVGTVKSTLSDARRKLQDLLGEEYR